MQVATVTSANTKTTQPRYINSKATGYMTTGGLALSVISGISKNKSLKKCHKSFAIITSLLIAFHIFSVEYNKKMYKKTNPDLNIKI